MARINDLPGQPDPGLGGRIGYGKNDQGWVWNPITRQYEPQGENNTGVMENRTPFTPDGPGVLTTGYSPTDILGPVIPDPTVNKGPVDPGPLGGGGGPLANPAAGPSQFQFPMFTAPGFTPTTPLQAPSPYQFTPFDPREFHAPTLEEARNQPGYLFGLQQGQDSLLNNAALRGTIRGGATAKGLFDYTNAAAEQNYGNVFNQDLTTFNTNEGNRYNSWLANEGGKLGQFNTNFGAAKDVNTSLNQGNQQNYQNAYQNAVAEFNPKANAANLTFQDQYNRWLAKLNSLTNIAMSGAS